MVATTFQRNFSENKSAGGEGVAAQPLQLRLGRIGGGIEVPAGVGPLDLRAAGATPEAVPWLRLPRPESGDFLAFLWRNPTGRNWGEAVALGLLAKLEL